MTQNQKFFRRILIGIALIAIFLLGSILNINFSNTVSLTLATVIFIALAAVAGGLIIGYLLGANKSFKFRKNNSNKK